MPKTTIIDLFKKKAEGKKIVVISSGAALMTWERFFGVEDGQLVPPSPEPDDILLFVAGGSPGPSSLVIPGWNTSSQSITAPYRTD